MSQQRMLGRASQMDPALEKLIQAARERGPMTPREQNEQRRSFVRAGMSAQMSDEEKNAQLDKDLRNFCPNCSCGSCSA